jgi:hypothetical protein
VTTKARAFMNNENVHVNCAKYIKVMLGELSAEGLLEDIFI